MAFSEFYKYAAIALLCLNIGILTFFFLGAKKHQHHHHHMSTIKDILQLDKAQNELFLQYAKAHNNKINSLNNQQKEQLEPYFYQHIYFDETFNQDSIIRLVQNIERQKIEITFQHYEEIKGLLKADQKPHFEEFMKKSLELILHKRKKKPHSPKEK